MMIRSERRRLMYAAWIVGVGLATMLIMPPITASIAGNVDYASLWTVGYPIWQLDETTDAPLEHSLAIGRAVLLTRIVGGLLTIAGAVLGGVTYSKHHMRDKLSAAESAVPAPKSMPTLGADGRTTSADGRVSW